MSNLTTVACEISILFKISDKILVKVQKMYMWPYLGLFESAVKGADVFLSSCISL